MAKTAARKRPATTSRDRSQPKRARETPAKERPAPDSNRPLATRLQAQQAALVSLAKNEAIQRGDLARVYQTITEVAARNNDVGRASIWLYNQDRSGIVLQDLYELEAGRHSTGTVLQARDFPAYFSALQREEYAIAASDAHTDPRTHEFSAPYLKPLRIGAMLDTPIRRKGRIFGVLCLEHIGRQRTWTTEEVSHTSSLAAMITLALDIAERVQVEEALRRSQDELEQRIKDRTAELTKTVASLWQERTFSDALLESLPGVIYLYDESGRFLQWNKNFERVTGYTGNELARMHPLDFFSGPEKELVSAKIREVFQKGAADVEADFVAKDGTRTPYYFTGAAIQVKDARCLIGMGIDITSRRHAEEAKQLFRILLDHIGDSIEIIDPRTGRFLDGNEKAWSSLGCTRDEFLSLKVPDIDPMVTPSVFTDIMQRLRKTEAPLILNSVHRRKDGSTFPVEVSTQLIRRGKEHVVAIVRDITERKQAEERLRESEERTRSIVDSALDGVITMDAHGFITGWNPQAERIFGYASAETIGQDLAATIIPPQHREAHRRGLQRFLASGHGPILGKRIEITALRRDGHEFPVELTVAPLKVSGEIHFSAFVNDITERKQAEEARRASEERYRTLFEYAPDGIVIADPQSRYIDANASICQMLGYTRDELIGLHASDIVAQAEIQHSEPALSINKTESDYHREWQFRRKDGSVFAAEVIATTMPDGNLLAMIRDVTERKQLENVRLSQLTAERANQSKSEFLSRMSHELRTPLNAVLGFAQLLEMEALNSEQQEHIQHILKGGRHLLSLINEVLDIARIEAGRMTLSLEPVSVSVVLGEAMDLVRPQAAARRIQLVKPAAPAGPVYVRAEQQRLKQVLLNLLSNGVKYNREGGTLTISCEAVPDRRYRVTVADTGGGIPPALMSRLFTPFDRLGADATTEGTGLGLVLSRNLMTAMGGTISVDSVVGRGTSFSIDLPLSEPPAARATATIPSKVQVTAPVSGSAVTVLYIEDNQSNYQLIEHLVEKRPGVKLIGAMQGKLGVELAIAHRPDLILLDLNLPDIQGDEVLLRLREHPDTAAIPVIMLSADAMQKQIDKLLAAGAKKYLTKPIDVAQFYALLDELMTKQGGR